jgi:hypothetical protein
VTFNNDIERDLATLERFHAFREEAESKHFRYFLEVFDPNVPGAVAPEILPHYINDMITRMLAGIGPTGRPLFLKMVYHGPKAMEELVRFDPHLVVGILGGSSGTTRDAFQLLHDAQKYGAKVALFGRKINHAENQLAFVHFLRLIVEGQIGPIEAVQAYHAVLSKLGLRPHRRLDDDLKLIDQSMSYAGTSTAVATSGGRPPRAEPRPPANGTSAVRATALAVRANSEPCPCQTDSAVANGPVEKCACPERRPRVTESYAAARSHHVTASRPNPSPLGERVAEGPVRGGIPSSNGRPDFTRMSPAERLAYHRQRLGLGR